MWRQGPHAQSVFQRISITRRFSAELVKLLVSVWSASGTYPHDAPVDNRPRPQPHGLRPIPGEAQMDEIVCANTAFRYCPLLPATGARSLPAPAQLRRRLASSIPSPIRNRRPQDPSHHSGINSKQPTFRDKTYHPMEQCLYREGLDRHGHGL